MAATTQRIFIKNLQPGDRIDGVYCVTDCALGKARNDSLYLRCQVGDRTGFVNARKWDMDEAHFRDLPTSGIVRVTGEAETYNNKTQVLIRSIEPHDATQEELADLIPTSARDIDEMFADLRGLIDTGVRHPFMRALADAYFADDRLMAAFKRSPAANSLHHAYIGGLLEHTLTLVRLATLVCPVYPKVNAEIVVLGLLIHDLGKTVELTAGVGFPYTDRGQLVGHIVDGAIILRKKVQEAFAASKIKPPVGLVTVLEHVVLSHHGKPEFGAAKIPATPEALLVSMLDNLDAKMFMALTATRPDDAGVMNDAVFTDRLWALDNVKFYRPDPLASGDNGSDSEG